MSGSNGNRGWRFVWAGGLLAVGLVAVATPLLTYGALYVDHALDYDGRCGPHAPDIPEHPCTEDEYLAEFGGGFAFIGLLMIVGVVTAFSVTGTLALWLLVALLYALARRRQSVASS